MTNVIAQTAVGVDRVRAILEADTLIPQQPGARTPGSLKGEITFEHVAFGYEADQPAGSRAEEALEIIEVVVLALVAIATAWSGYQAARWDDHRAQLYAEATKLKVGAEELNTLAGQERIHDITTFNSWLAAKVGGNQRPAALFERRFRDEYRNALLLGSTPILSKIPKPRSVKREEAKRLNVAAAAITEHGTQAGDTGDRYMRVTACQHSDVESPRIVAAR
ncbi:MAG: hypothetical protein WA603_16590 [Candidatus Acidiferrales bacterium]